MAYENGESINRHYVKLYGKEKQKLRHMRVQGFEGTNSFETFLKLYEARYPTLVEESPYWPPKYANQHKEYWRGYYSSGRRKVAKWQSTMISRASVRKLKELSMEELEDVATMTRGQEKKAFDFWWTID